MPENPDEIQYAESFKIRHEAEVVAILNKIITADNVINQFQIVYIEDDVYTPYHLFVLYSPLTDAEIEQRMINHLRKFERLKVTDV